MELEVNAFDFAIGELTEDKEEHTPGCCSPDRGFMDGRRTPICGPFRQCQKRNFLRNNRELLTADCALKVLSGAQVLYSQL